MFCDQSFNVAEAVKGVCQLSPGEFVYPISIHHLYPDSVCIYALNGDLDISPDDIQQGNIGDCWLLSALSVIAQKDKTTINDLIKYSTDGWSVVCIMGVNMIVDHYIPCVIDPTGSYVKRMIGPKLSPQKEFWPILLEKAFIKFFSSNHCPTDIRNMNIMRRIKAGVQLHSPSYIDIHGGFPRWVFSIIYNVKIDPLSSRNQQQRWCDLLAAEDVISCACTSTEKDDTNMDEGFVYGHAYGIIGCDPALGLIRVRNPWGTYESKLYDDGVDDGSFWVDESTFREKFPHVVMMRLSKVTVA